MKHESAPRVPPNRGKVLHILVSTGVASALRERAEHERRTLSNMAAVLLERGLEPPRPAA